MARREKWLSLTSTNGERLRIGQSALENVFFRRARSHRRCERKATIDGGGHDLPSLRQAQLLSSNEPLTILHSADPPEPREAGYVG